MEKEIEDLKEEIEVLIERIEMLEKSNNRRKAYGYAKILIRISLILLSAYGIWRGYEYVTTEVPKMLEEKVKELNPIKSNN